MLLKTNTGKWTLRRKYYDNGLRTKMQKWKFLKPDEISCHL